MRSAVLGLIALAACAVGAGSLPSHIEPVVADLDTERQLRDVRLLYERGDAPAALHALEPLVVKQPDSVDVQRARQDILRSRGRTALLRSEAEARLRAAPEDAVARYLLARLLPPGAAQQEAFQRAVDADPELLWPWLGLAFSKRVTDPGEALAIYERLYTASGRHPSVAIGYGQVLRARGKSKEALAVYEQLAASRAQPGIGELGIAQTAMAAGDLKRAWAGLLEALRQRPFDPGVHSLIRDMPRAGLGDDQTEQILDELRASPARWDDFARDGLEVLVPMLQRSGHPHAALGALGAAKPGALSPQLRREQRRLLLALGDVAGFLRLLRADLPAALLLDESNQVRGRWLAVLGYERADQQPMASEAKAAGFAAALRDCGLLAESERFSESALQAFPDSSSLRALREEVQREIAFENGLRRAIYRGYGEKEALSLVQFCQLVRDLSKATLGRDVVGEVVQFSAPMVGELLDPFAAGLCLHLARYNHHLTLGRRSGGVIEGLAMTRLSVRDLPEDPSLPLLGRCREVIGCDREVRSLSGVLGGDLAGVALISHYVIDHDAVRDWAAGIAARMRVAREDGGAVLTDPMPEQIDVHEPLDVSWRLAAQSPLREDQLEAAVLDVVARHERRHLVDSFHYLPLEANLWRGLGLLVRSGFSPAAIEGEMERRAEVAALALSPHTDVVLSHIAEFMDDFDPSSPHVQGFGQLGRELVAGLQQQGVPAAEAAVARWHRLDRAMVARVARALLDRLP